MRYKSQAPCTAYAQPTLVTQMHVVYIGEL